MPGLNKVMLIGYLGADMELRYTSTQTPVGQMRLATTVSWYDAKTKQRKDHTEWHTVVVWGGQAEHLAKVVSKGTKVYVEGEIRTRSWEDKQGNKRYMTEIKAQDVQLLGNFGSSQDDRNANRQQQQRREPEPSPPSNEELFNDDDIPF